MCGACSAVCRPCGGKADMAVNPSGSLLTCSSPEFLGGRVLLQVALAPQRCPHVAKSQAPCPPQIQAQPQERRCKASPPDCTWVRLRRPSLSGKDVAARPAWGAIWGCWSPGEARWSPTSFCHRSFLTSSERKRPLPVSPWPPSDLSSRGESPIPRRAQCWAGRGPGRP